MRHAWDKKGESTGKNMREVRTSVHLEKEMGEGLGGSEILQQTLRRVINDQETVFLYINHLLKPTNC